MKSLTLLLAFCISSFGFATAACAQEVRSLLNQNEKFTSDGKVYEDETYGFPTYHEDGVLNGVKYRIYFLDGGGTFEGVKGNGLERIWNKNKTAAQGLKDIADMKKNWVVRCFEDAVDILTCAIVVPGISVIVDTKGRVFVSVNGGDDPRGETVGIRFGDGTSFTGGKDSQFLGATANQIIERLKTAKQITTWFRSPRSRLSKTQTVSLYGFNEAFTYLNWLVNKCRKTYDARKDSEPDLGGHGFQPCK